MLGLNGKAVVADGHTLGVLMGSSVQVLRSSVLRGSPWAIQDIGLWPVGKDVRQATRKDFDDFRVTWHPDYIVA